MLWRLHRKFTDNLILTGIYFRLFTITLFQLLKCQKNMNQLEMMYTFQMMSIWLSIKKGTEKLKINRNCRSIIVTKGTERYARELITYGLDCQYWQPACHMDSQDLYVLAVPYVSKIEQPLPKGTLVLNDCVHCTSYSWPLILMPQHCQFGLVWFRHVC